MSENDTIGTKCYTVKLYCVIRVVFDDITCYHYIINMVKDSGNNAMFSSI